jgi:hypothetical protein
MSVKAHVGARGPGGDPQRDRHEVQETRPASNSTSRPEPRKPWPTRGRSLIRPPVACRGAPPDDDAVAVHPVTSMGSPGVDEVPVRHHVHALAVDGRRSRPAGGAWRRCPPPQPAPVALRRRGVTPPWAGSAGLQDQPPPERQPRQEAQHHQPARRARQHGRARARGAPSTAGRRARAHQVRVRLPSRAPMPRTPGDPEARAVTKSSTPSSPRRGRPAAVPPSRPAAPASGPRRRARGWRSPTVPGTPKPGVRISMRIAQEPDRHQQAS